MAKTNVKQKTSFVRHKTSQETSQDFDRRSDEIEKINRIRQHLAPGKGLMKTQTEAAAYIAEMLVVLCNMAKDVDLRFLNYLLEMAYEESLSHSGETSKIIKNHAP